MFLNIQKEIPVSIGTDGAASNNNLNMFEEMHLAGILYKGLHLDSTMVSPKQVIKAATLGRKIAEGEKADLIMIDMKAPHLHPVNDVDALIVYAMQGSDVDTVIVNGEILMENKVITRLDEEKIIYEKKFVDYLRNFTTINYFAVMFRLQNFYIRKNN